MYACSVASVVSNSATLWTINCQALLFMGFSGQEYWSGLPCPPQVDLPNPGTQPRSPTLQADSLPSEPPGKPKNTRVGSLSLLQGIFPIQALNWSLLSTLKFWGWCVFWTSDNEGSWLNSQFRHVMNISCHKALLLSHFIIFPLTPFSILSSLIPHFWYA